MKRALGVVVVALLASVGLASARPAARIDYAAVALNVLPPGQSGSLALPPTATDQLALYDGLTPLFDNVRPADLTKYFKSARFGPGTGKPRSVQRPRKGVRIVRDRWDVPHVYGVTRRDVAFGAGWATAQDRSLLMNLLRGPGRIAALDAPGYNAFALANAGRVFRSSPQTEAFLAAQSTLLRQQGPKGREVLRDIDAYVAGINAYNKHAKLDITPWTRNDVVAVAAVIGGVFGAGGGDEARASQFLSALQNRLGAGPGRTVWNDLRQLDDREAPVSVGGTFTYGTDARSEAGNAVLDDGSFQRATSAFAAPPDFLMSNALLLGRGRSATGRPLFVAGPQTGHNYPQILMELDLHGGGFDVRGAAFPGVSMAVLIGRGKDFAWSATSANGDIVDEFVEELCGDDTHYRHKGECRAMGVFDAGTLVGVPGSPDERIVFRTTVHGPVSGYATVGGRRVAIAKQRSTRGRELLSAIFFADLNLNRVTSAQSFLRTANQMEMTFNWLYADERDIAQFTSGRLPIRSADVNPGLPTRGTGEYEWSGFLGFGGHPRTVNHPDGAILNWNNRPAHRFAAADDDWSWGSVQRVELLERGIAARQKHTLASVVSVMNKAATQDLRAVEVWPTIRAVLGPTPPAGLDGAGVMAGLVDTWAAAGASRLDRDLDGKIDDSGAAILDAAWPKLADAVMSPVLGPLVDRLAALETRDDVPAPDASAYGSGWYGYVDKDLRALLGQPVAQPFATRFCGNGNLAACRSSLWAALNAAGAELSAKQGGDPRAWRSDATKERISFGFLGKTARFTNRPTFQQVISFNGHRPR